MKAASNTRYWTIGGLLVTFVVLVLGFFLGVQPQLQAANIAERDLAEVEAQNQLQRIELQALKDQFEMLPEITAELDALRESIPATASIETFTTQLSALAAASGVTLVTVTASAGAPFIPAPQVEALLPPGVDGSTFVTIPFQLSAVGPRDGIIAFLAGIQNGLRLAAVDQFTMVNSGDEGAIAIDMSGLLYVLLDEPATFGAPDGGTAPVEPVDPAAP